MRTDLFFGRTSGQQSHLFLLHFSDRLPDGIHGIFAFVGKNLLRCRGKSFCFAQFDSGLQLGKLNVHLRLDRRQPLLLARIVNRQFAQVSQFLVDKISRATVWRQIAIFAGDDVTALARLRVLHAGQ